MTPAADAPPARELATEDLVGAFGPEHPTFSGLRLVLTLDGEQVSAAEVELGYRHRGLEKLAERSWDAAARLASRVDPLAPHAGAAAFASAIEALGEIEIPQRARRLRVVVLELERAASHVGAVRHLLALLGLVPAERLAGALQDRLVRIGQHIAGAAGDQFVVVGGVAGDPSDDRAAELAGQLDGLRPDLAALGRQLEGRLVRGRLEGLGQLAADRAVASGTRGPVARACRVRLDARAGDPTYRELGFAPVLNDAGDSLARYRVRLGEIDRALELAARAAAGAELGPLRTLPAPPAGPSPARPAGGGRESLQAPPGESGAGIDGARGGSGRARPGEPPAALAAGEGGRPPAPAGHAAGRTGVDPATRAEGESSQARAAHDADCTENDPGEPADGVRFQTLAAPPAGLACGSVEGPRGELAVWIASDGGGGPRRIAFHGPSLAHVMLLPTLLAGCRYADVPLIVASLDLSMDEAER